MLNFVQSNTWQRR